MLLSINVFRFGCYTYGSMYPDRAISIDWYLKYNNSLSIRMCMLWRHHSQFNKSSGNWILAMRLAWNGSLHSYTVSICMFVWKLKANKRNGNEKLLYYYLLLSEPVSLVCDVRECWITHQIILIHVKQKITTETLCWGWNQMKMVLKIPFFSTLNDKLMNCCSVVGWILNILLKVKD